MAGTTARAAAELIDVQANAAMRFYQRLRQLIASKLPSYELSGEVEVDKSYLSFCYFSHKLGAILVDQSDPKKARPNLELFPKHKLTPCSYNKISVSKKISIGG